MAKVLIVDDSRDLLEAYQIFLETTTSHEIRTATTARAAFEIVRAWRPDIVVTDVMMPDMNGLELISEIRSQIPPRSRSSSRCPGFPSSSRRRGGEAPASSRPSRSTRTTWWS